MAESSHFTLVSPLDPRATLITMVRAYYELTKPRVMYGNLLTTVAGFLFAANGQIDWLLFMATTIGTAFVISSACVINNYLDQDIDARMERTLKRPLITGEVTERGAIVFGIALLVLGLLILATGTNWWVFSVGLFGFVTYVWLYGALGKRKSVHGTLVGSLSGAAPILAGYVAVSNRLDTTAVLLFAVLFFWQMPEFYSISIYRVKEYAKANIPVSAVVRGIAKTKQQIFAYTVLTCLAMLALIGAPQTGHVYGLAVTIMSVYWLRLSYYGLKTNQSAAWARKNFHVSLVILVLFSFIISIQVILV